MIKAGFIGFRPLTGIKVSERMVLLPILDNNDMVSVPSRGLRYLNISLTTSKKPILLRFRPLTGIKVSEQQLEYALEQGSYGFRPLTGIKVSELYILCHPGHDILYIVFKVFSVSDIPLITTPYYTINT